MKKLINDPRRVVPEMLEGLVAITPGLALLEGETVVVRADAPLAEHVALIAGGGAGHEPAHAGYVGPGMLTAAVSGDVFTSPATDAVLAAIRAVAGRKGVLLIVKNYTGDRLNFGLAAELARAEGIPVEMVIVDDDVALAADGRHAGRRGIAGVVLVHKLAGAAAAHGMSLAEVKRVAEEAIGNLGSMGVALTPCTVPAAGRPGFTLGDDEMELGLGIHGEAGVHRAPIAPVDTIVDELLTRIVADRGIVAGEQVALLVNGLGGTPAMELAIVARSAIAWLERAGINVARVWCGSFLTALEMAGCSLSLLRVNDERLRYLDAPALTSAWPAVTSGPAGLRRAHVTVTSAVLPPPSVSPGKLGVVLHAVCAALRQAEHRLTTLDQAVGDGDLGISLARGAEAVEHAMPGFDLASPSATLRALSATLLRALGGTTGPLYAAFLLRAATTLEGQPAPAPADWTAAFQAGIDAIMELGGAQTGDRTMIDALHPACEALQSALAEESPVGEALFRAVSAARDGAARTAGMIPRRGRSSYLGSRALGHSDPGAEAVVVWLEAVRNAVR
jgi:triose/dihydroxyacetone kinase / FAD-AMP lyase (cyclizing)